MSFAWEAVFLCVKMLAGAGPALGPCVCLRAHTCRWLFSVSVSMVTHTYDCVDHSQPRCLSMCRLTVSQLFGWWSTIINWAPTRCRMLDWLLRVSWVQGDLPALLPPHNLPSNLPVRSGAVEFPTVSPTPEMWPPRGWASGKYLLTCW